MKREKTIGAFFGITGGVLGLVIFAFLFEMHLQQIIGNPLESLSLILPTLGFSLLFGSHAGTNITQRNYHPILAQLWSGILTLICTIVAHAALMSLLLPDASYFGVIPMALIMSIYFGSIPILILSVVFGLAFKPILRAQS